MTQQALEQFLAHYLEQMRSGEDDDAFFSIINANAAIVPLLIDAFSAPENRDIRARIVECIWQHRLPESIGFLGGVLDDSQPGVWQQALDGLVTIGGADAIHALELARVRLQTSTSKGAITSDWIDEALEHLQSERGTAAHVVQSHFARRQS